MSDAKSNRRNFARACFKSKSLPWLVQMYRYVYEQRRRGRLEMAYGAILRRVFWLVLKGCRSPVWGTFEYLNPRESVTVLFDGRNTQFHSVYLAKYEDGYEPETCVLLDSCLVSASTVWDVGSNWGYFALYACSHPQFHGKVHAFEPIAATFHDLQNTVQQAGLADRVECHSFALGEHGGISRTTLPDGVHSGLSALTDDGAGERVEVRAADSLDIPDPDVIKLDVEGFEAAVLRGARRVIARAKPMIIMESWLGPIQQTLEPLRVLEELGYRLFQPAWLFEGPDGRYCSRSSRSSNDCIRRLGLTLLPFAAAERGMLGDYANLFACHHSRAAELSPFFSLTKALETKDLQEA